MARKIRVVYNRHRKTWNIHKKGKVIVAHARKQRWEGYKTDLGHVGKGSPTGVFISVKAGKLMKFGYSTAKPQDERRRALKRAVDRYGATSVFRSLNAQMIFRKNLRNNPAYDKEYQIFKSDRDWVENTFMKGSLRHRW